MNLKATLIIEDQVPCTWDAVVKAIEALTETASQEYDDWLSLGDGNFDSNNSLTIEYKGQ